MYWLFLPTKVSMAPDHPLKFLKNLPDPQQTQMDLIKGYVASFITRLKPKRAQKNTELPIWSSVFSWMFETFGLRRVNE